MEKPLQLALPLMLHSESEIPAFVKAQERLRKIGNEEGVPLNTGAFLLFLPSHSRKPESFEKQLENQRTHRLPIRIVETGVQRQNSLSYDPRDPTYDPTLSSDLERTLEHVALLRDLDPTAPSRLVVAPHVGILVFDSLKKGDFSRPGFYSINDFVELREDLFGRAQERFGKLADKAGRLGLRLALENTYSAVFENIGFWQRQGGGFEMDYQVFNDFPSLDSISGGSLVFDSAHFAAMHALPASFQANQDVIHPGTLFKTLNISSWQVFQERAGTVRDYLDRSHGLHLSPTDGPGIRVPAGSEDGRRWGDGTGPDLTPPESYNLYVQTARDRGLPVAIEVDYNVKDPNFDFSEADPFVRSLLTSYRESITT